MFSNAKVGDRVWGFTKGWATIINTEYGGDGCIYPILVRYSNGDNECYTRCGKLYEDDIYQSLFWDEIKFDIPKKPLPKLEVDAKVLV